MVKKYQILEGIARADVAYQVFGKTIEELFVNAAEAVSQTMVDITAVQPLLSSKCKVQSSKLEELFLDFINELIFLKDAKNLIFSKYQLKITHLDARNYQLDAFLWGDKIDPKKHKLRLDVKAVTRHKLNIKKAGNIYEAIIVLDI